MSRSDVRALVIGGLVVAAPVYGILALGYSRSALASAVASIAAFAGAVGSGLTWIRLGKPASDHMLREHPWGALACLAVLLAGLIPVIVLSH